MFFVADPAGDAHADCVREYVQAAAGARAWAGRPPGYFDDDATVSERTTGGFLPVEGAPAVADVGAFYEVAIAVSAQLEVAVELQWRESILGHIRCGEPDEGLTERVAGVE